MRAGLLVLVPRVVPEDLTVKNRKGFAGSGFQAGGPFRSASPGVRRFDPPEFCTVGCGPGYCTNFLNPFGRKFSRQVSGAEEIFSRRDGRWAPACAR